MIKRIAVAAALAGAALSVSPADAVAAPTPVEPPPSSHAGRLHVTAPAKGMPAKPGRGKSGKRGPAKSQAPMGVPEMPDATPPQDQSLHPGVIKGLGKLNQLHQLNQVGAATQALSL
ncbi:hypothetical protein [Streptomyces triculaminicus]|uniref:hypothetical protein n=1 Tax=Streptomyces triculaminicus TaxID=2816232 RepID=UPI00378A3BEA